MLLVAWITFRQLTSTVHLRDGSAWTIVHAATLRKKLQTTLVI